MKIAVIGAGAIGGLVAGYLKKDNQDVLLIARKNQVDAIKQNGLNIEGARGKLNINLPAKEKLDEIVDLVILAVKTHDIDEAIKQNLPLIKDSKILTTQNGVRAEEIISSRIAEKNIFSSIVMFGATYLKPGKIVHNFEGDLLIGKFSEENTEFLENIEGATKNAFNTKIVKNIKGMKWTKLFINMNNCLPAILGRSMQETFKDVEISKISINLWKEAKDLADKSEIKLENLPTFPVERIAGLTKMPFDQAANIYSGIMTGLSKEPLYGSVLQSIQRRRSSEIDYINGEIVNLARKNNSCAPLNEKMVEMVHEVERSHKFLSKEELLMQMKGLVN